MPGFGPSQARRRRRNPGGTPAPTPPPGIGGTAIGSAGSGIYSGYTLSDGDDFTSLDLASAANPAGAYFPTRVYQSVGGSRAPASGPLNVMHDVSPDYTGWADQARGVAQNYDSHSVAGGVLTLKSIRQTAGQQTNLATGVAGQIERAAMVHTAGRLLWNSPAIIEWRAKLPPGPLGQHPTLWTFSADPPGGPSFTGNESGFEGSATRTSAYHNIWNAGATTYAVLDLGTTYRDANFHVFTVIIGATNYTYYVDGVLVHTIAVDPDTSGPNKPDYALITNHIYSPSFLGEAYSAAAWAADADGVNVEVDWIRVWRPTATGAHYAPLTGIADTAIVHGATTTIVLPAQTTLWGASGLTEYVYAIQHEVEEPGGNANTASWTRFPTGVTYNSGTRTISVANTLVGSGTLHFAVAVTGDGITCKPARFRLNVAPRWTGAASYSWTDGVAIAPVDVYTSWDAGRLFQAGANPKGLTVTGLPTGLSFSSATGLITGTPAGVASGNLAIGCTNSAGQTTSRTQGFAVADATAPILSSPLDAANGSGAATISVSTNEANGTLYWFISTLGTPPTAANLKTGTGATVAGNQPVTTTGVQNSAPSGLTGSTAYFAHFLHRDAAGNDSAIASADGFTTTAAPDVTAPTLSLPTDAANGATGGTLSVTTNEANGTLYWFVSTLVTPPTAANLKTGTGAVSSGNQAVVATGVQNSSATGLTASTAYFAHFLHRDAAGNDSAIVSGDGFTTTAGGAAAYTSWTGPGWFDASDTATVTKNGSNQVTAMTNKRSGGGNLTGEGTLANRVATAAAQNGLAGITISRDISSGTSPPRLVAASTATLSTMCQGNDKPYTIITVYKPTDTSTGFIWAWTDPVDATDSQNIALIRRTTNASVRRLLTTAAPLDASWGSGQASGTARVVAVKHSGTAVTVWDNSATTKAVNASTQDAAAFNTQLIFALFAAETNNATDPTWAPAQCSMIFCECVVQDSAMADADIQQAITDLGTKWGISVP